MDKSIKIRTGRHCVFAMHVHLVFVSKYRKKIFDKEHLDYMKSLFQRICKDFESELIEFNGESDHIHLLINYPPKVCISKLVNSLKGVSSRKLKYEFPEIKKYYWKNALWSPSYFAASCGGAPLNIIREYIENQNIPK
jgi:Transposase and inactivated derivatives